MTSFREEDLDKIAPAGQTTPLNSPPNSTHQREVESTSKTTPAEIKAPDCIPPIFYTTFHKADFSNLEILALRDCKIIEASVISFIKSNHHLISSLESDYVVDEIVSIFIYYTDIEAKEGNPGLGEADGGQEMEVDEESSSEGGNGEVYFAEDAIISPNIPVYLRRANGEAYEDYLERITLFLEVR